jgi:hypothetical protein
MRVPKFRAVTSAALAAALTAIPGAGRAETHAAPAAISVNLQCTSDSITCEAVAWGGTGAYSFVWTNAEEGYTEGSYSEAAPHCWSGHSKFTVSVTVTDGLGATGTASRYFVCP